MRYVIGIDTPGGVGVWGEHGPILSLTAHVEAKGMPGAALFTPLEMLRQELGPPLAVGVEVPYGIEHPSMQQDVLLNARRAGWIASRLSEWCGHRIWMPAGPQWRSHIGIRGSKAQMKKMARVLAARAYEYVEAETPAMSEHASEGMCIAMATWLKYGAPATTEKNMDTLVAMLGLASLRGALGGKEELHG